LKGIATLWSTFGLNPKKIIHFQGGTIRALLNLLCIKRQEHHAETLNEGVANSVFSLILCGVESITQGKGNGYIKVKNSFKTKISRRQNNHFSEKPGKIGQQIPEANISGSKCGSRAAENVPQIDS
jgi:hypothetical protein